MECGDSTRTFDDQVDARRAATGPDGLAGSGGSTEVVVPAVRAASDTDTATVEARNSCNTVPFTFAPGCTEIWAEISRVPNGVTARRWKWRRGLWLVARYEVVIGDQPSYIRMNGGRIVTIVVRMQSIDEMGGVDCDPTPERW